METATEQEQVVSLVFDCYELYKFMESVSDYTEEVNIIFEGTIFTMQFQDMSRIILCRCTKQIDTTIPLQKMTFPIDPRPLKELLKTRKKDKKEVELVFNNTKKYIEITKKSTVYNSTNIKSLNLLDDKIEEMPLDNLYAIEHPSRVSFPIKYLEDFFYESGKCSEVVTISINDNGLTFIENGVIGASVYLIEAQYCNILEGKQEGTYSLELLSKIKPILPILNVDDYITMHVKINYPIYVKLRIEPLDMDMDVFLAPRCEIEEDDDDDDDDYEF